MLLPIIIPVYNEAESLPTLMDQTRKILEDMAARDRCLKVLQDPPELLPEMLGLMRLGYDLVSAQLRAGPGDGIWKCSTAAAFYCLQIIFSETILTAVGLVGSYVARIYEQSKQRPLYVVAALNNVEMGETLATTGPCDGVLP